MHRIQSLNSHFEPVLAARKKGKPTDNVWESMNLDVHLRPEVVQKRKAVEKLMKENYVDINKHVISTEHPAWMVPKIQALNINGLQIKDFGGPGFTNLEAGAVIMEMAKYDASIATLVLVHNAIGQMCVECLGDEEQRRRILPETMNMDKIICFGLTEPDYGSDASSLKTTAAKVDGGYLLNGEKTWIGNSTISDYIVIWARNMADGDRVQAFIVTKGSRGLKIEKIENKYSLRIVQNGHIELKDVFVPDNNKLTKSKDFKTGTSLMLE